MLMVIVIASFYVEDDEKDYGALSWICFLMVLSVLGGAIFAVLYNFLGRFLRQKKRFQFFLCHHKAGSGAYTRLLQMNLLENPRTAGDVFIDSDHLDNLDHLFDYVRTDTKMFVVIVSSDVFTRPWCIGEMTTARVAKIISVLVTLPGGGLPDEEFITKLTECGLQNSDVLTQAGVDTVMLCRTLAWTNSLPNLKMQQHITSIRMTHMADSLHTVLQTMAKRSSKRAESVGSSISDPKWTESKGVHMTSSASEVYCVFDIDNIDACSACHVLQRMLIPLSDYATELVPYIPDSVTSLPSRMATAIVMCTNGIFENSTCAKMFVHVFTHRHISYPVLAEPTFRFPPPDAHAWLHQMFSARLQLQEILDASSCITLLFKEIATQFQPNTASLSVLQVSAREVFRRVVAMKKRPMHTPTHASSGKMVSRDNGTSPGRQPVFHSSGMTTAVDEGEQALVGKRMSPEVVELDDDDGRVSRV